MCKAVEWYVKILEALDHNSRVLCMLAGFIVLWWGGEKFDAWNDKMMAITEKQAIVQMELVKALEGLSVRVGNLEEWHAREERKEKDKHP